MAGWQCRFCIVPKYTVQQYATKNNDDILVWNKEEIPIDELKSVEKQLPIEASWASYITQYGNLQETCIEVVDLQNDKVEISIRLDLTKLSQDTYNVILNFIKACDCAIYVVSTKSIYSGNEDSLKKVIKESIAYRLGKKYNIFVANL